MSLDPFSDQQNWQSRSIRSRFLVSIASNIFRGVLSFITGLIIARGLGPENYGHFVFLTGSFVAIQAIMDLGTSNAFFTFISQRPRGKNFINYYRVWQLAQFLLPILIIGFLLPDAWISSIWIGEERRLILLAFAAVFLKPYAWQTVLQIGESQRLTKKVEALWFFLVLVHFLLVMIFWLWGFLSLTWLFGLIIVEYVIGLFLAEIVLGTQTLEKIPVEFKPMVREYTIYCAPLVLMCLAGFVKDFSERWLLQTFGGAIEQGLYGIAFQIAVAISLFTTSIQKIFWKETAEGIENQDLGKVEKLYKRVTRILFAISAAISGFLIPWSKEIIELLFGVSYLGGVWTFEVLLIYPVYHALAATTSALYFASQKSMMRAKIGIIFLSIHILVTYFVVAPGEAWLPGLELGSYGIALKLVILQIISANVLIWWISKDYRWKYDWSYQVIVLSFTLGLGWVCHEMVLGISSALPMNLLVKFGLVLMLYFSIFGLAIWKRPGLIGMTQEDIRGLMVQVMRIFKVKV